MSIFAGPKIVEEGLVLYLDAANQKSYPGTGITWTNLSNNANNGSLINGPSYNSANKGFFSFDGSNDYVSFSSNPSLTNQISFEVVVFLNSTTPNGNGWILGREGSYRMTYNQSSINWVCATTNNGWYTTGTSINAQTLVTSKVTHIIGTYNGSNVRLYVDGVLMQTGSNISGNILTNGTYELMKSSAFNIDYGKGNLYLHKMYNRALSLNEIKQNFEATRGRYGI